MIRIMKPEYVFPVSGEFRQMHAHSKLAGTAGIPSDHIYLLDRGDVVQYKDHNMTLLSSVPAANTLIDGSGVGDIGNVVLKDRRILSEDGIFVVIVTISRSEGKILAGPEVISRGFIFMKQSDEIIAASQDLVRQVVEKQLKDQKHFDWSKLKNDIRDNLSRYLYKETQRRPMVLPVIEEASHRRKKHNFMKG